LVWPYGIADLHQHVPFNGKASGTADDDVAANG